MNLLAKISSFVHYYGAFVFILQTFLDEMILVILNFQRYMVLFLVLFSLVMVIGIALKIIFEVPRPRRVRVKMSDVIVDKRSFPSLHTSAASYLAFSMLFYKPLFIILLLWALFVGFSRVYLRAHRYTEVIFGFTLGAIFGIIFAFAIYGFPLLFQSLIWPL